MATITLCMIVRDEEAMLRACLESARAAVDETVVIDTGSRDATKRVAADAGAKVFDFVWCDDFAAARNEALRRARGRWVLVLDADERLAPGAAQGVRAAIEGARFDCGMLRLHEATRIDAPPGDVVSGRDRQSEVQLVPRLLRRADGLRYVDPIHENVAPWLRRRGSKLGAVDADIVHLGATKQVVDAKSKVERNVRLLTKRLERDPADLAAYGYLAHDLLRAGSTERAFETVERGWAQVVALGAEPWTTSIHRLATARAYLLIAKGRFAEAREAVGRVRSVEGENPDFAFLEANAYECEALGAADRDARRGLLAAARDRYAQCSRFAGRLFEQSFVVGASSWCGFARLGTVELLLGRPREAMRAFDAALALRGDDRGSRLGQAEAMIDLGDAGGALRRIEPLLDDTGPDAWTLAAAAVEVLGLRDDVRLFARRAYALARKGFLAAHRRDRLQQLLQAVPPAVSPASGADVSHS